VLLQPEGYLRIIILLVTRKIMLTARFDRILNYIAVIVELCFGVHVGAFAGWVSGWLLGCICRDYFNPVYFSDFDSIYWCQLGPYKFAKIGFLVGIPVGMILISILQYKIQKKRTRDR
jgi:hypothetical protein